MIVYILRIHTLLAIITITLCVTFSGSAQEQYLTFQSIKYRTGGANRAFIGSVGLKRNEGKNAFYVMYRPVWTDLPIERTGAFFRNDKAGFNMEVGGGGTPNGSITVSGKVSRSATNNRSGTFTIYQISNIKTMVDQLNDSKNQELRRYLMQSKDFRIVTAMVLVTDHEETRGKATSVTLDAKSAAPWTPSIRINYGGTNTSTLTINDNMIYAYEYGRLIWAKDDDGFFNHKLGQVVDILVDRPSTMFNWGDAESKFINGTENPLKPLKLLRLREASSEKTIQRQ